MSSLRRPSRLVLAFPVTLALATACGVTVVGLGDEDAPPAPIEAGTPPPPGALGDGGVDAALEVVCGVEPCVKQLAAGYQFTCAVLADRSVRCWGTNVYGALGRELPDAAPETEVPGPVDGVADVVQLAAGLYHACVLRADGKVLCWGLNDRAQLGPGADGGRVLAAVEVPAIPGPVKTLRAGGWFTCAQLVDGRVFCWGDARYGNLGGELEAGVYRPDTQPTPVEVASLGTPDELSAGVDFTCARTGGEIACVGSNAWGALGRGAVATAPTADAAPVLGLDRANALFESQGYFTCAMQEGEVYCWGFNYGAAAGVPSDAGFRIEVPARLEAGVAVNVSPGGFTTCAQTPEGTVRCWGWNAYGGVGAPPDAGSEFATPRDVPDLENVVQVAAGYLTNCALAKNGSVSCWGADSSGALGRPADSGVPNWNPAPVVF